jgi:hypothetical protein
MRNGLLNEDDCSVKLSLHFTLQLQVGKTYGALQVSQGSTSLCLSGIPFLYNKVLFHIIFAVAS